jgi:hypothetical protein
MINHRYMLLLVVLSALVACKHSDERASQCCIERCELRARAQAAIVRDIEAAERDAKSIEALQVRDDSEIKREGARGSSLCDDIRSSVAHARGLTSLYRDLDGALGGQLDAVEKVARTCHGSDGASLSPAQMKATLTPAVHAIKTSGLAEPAERDCSARCAQER